MPGGEAIGLALVLVIALLSAGAVGLLRETGWIERLELVAYDVMVRQRAGQLDQAPHAAVVTLDDAFLDAHGSPLPDTVLNDLILAARRQGAAVVALDVYRDVPVPPGTQRLAETFRSVPELVGGWRFPTQGHGGVAPPPAIPTPHRTGVTDMPLDPDGTLRRGALYLQGGTTVAAGLAMQSARVWLQKKGISPAGVADRPNAMKLGKAVFDPLPPGFGGYHRADTRGFQFLIDFRRNMADIPAVKAADLLAGKPDAGDLDGRAVFIGSVSRATEDLITTPLVASPDLKPLFGVFVHAIAADQIIRAALGASSLAAEFPRWAEFALLVIVAFSAASLFRLRTWPVLQVAAGLVGSAIVCAAAYLFFIRDIWLPVTAMLFAWMVGGGLTVAWREWHERRRRIALAGLLVNQISPAVAEDLWAHRADILDGHRPRPVRLTATVLFVDLAGSTSRADELDPERLVEWVSRFLDQMSDAVVENDGVIDKFTGDGLMALYGVPVPRLSEEEIAADVRRALETARSMRRRLAVLNRPENLNGLPHTECRIGIHTGPVSAGNVGSSARMQYTVIGQAANLAARLEGYGKDDPKIALDDEGNRLDCRILVSETAARYVMDEYVLVAKGSVALRGAHEPLGIYRLEAQTSTTERQPVEN